MEIDSIKESIIKEMPSRPVTRSEFSSRYGSRVDQVLRDLIEEGDLVRIKRGLYSLSDERLDEKAVEEEVELVFLPTEELKILIRSFYSQFCIKMLIEEGQGEVLKEVGYFNRSSLEESKEEFRLLRGAFLRQVGGYHLSEEGEFLINNM